ncbi:MAG: hypothetical protein JW786_08590 [Desulfobacterales bacterium]|nr:hypothetical protein [Desulfobacterales bacterium]
MPNKPNPFLLDRDQAAADANLHFSEALSAVEDIVNYGSNLIIRVLKTTEVGILEMVTIGILLKHVVSMFDGIHILLCNGAVYSSNLQLRSLLEASLYMQWILKQDSEHRASCFYVGDLRRKLQWNRRHQIGTPENQEYLPGFNWRKPRSEREEAELNLELQKDEQALGDILNADEFRHINQTFAKLRKNKKYDVPWYKVAGTKSVFQIADDLQRTVEYEFIYTFGSEVIHPSSCQDHVAFDGDTVSYVHIRSLEGINVLLRAAIPTTLWTYQIALKHFRPTEIANFSKRYVDEWRKPFWSMKKVEIKPIVEKL